ncbi:serine protease grass [Drosophila virilis]|uniref:Peptidase S1 domain-containing protein n=1 Tax=Drosophila virilis TaxID=7244 RepID=B4LM19_DROVI|nr:serine protease grass [Drosophila virilis]XP_015030360.1 serine protease grass [Drosophila virilis]EDW59939.2 uncharacterized protein Dvir_GJ21215 [Drosophila virilis]KRF79168.1 uncharacterized protein Dvir_GJ26958 [Drosophila virilis]
MRSTKLILFHVGLFAICATTEINPDGLRILEQQNCGIGKNVRLIGNATEVIPGSRPWMALIKNNDTISPYYCIGTLITDQFVLTVAHCASKVELESVTLGNNNLLTDEDCFKSKNSNGNNCLPAVERFGIETVIVHEHFTFNENYANDIALLKLSKKVKFQDHISPICLPVNATLQQQVETLATLGRRRARRY